MILFSFCDRRRFNNSEAFVSDVSHTIFNAAMTNLRSRSLPLFGDFLSRPTSMRKSISAVALPVQGSVTANLPPHLPLGTAPVADTFSLGGSIAGPEEWITWML
jgi:hypothetical protein